MSMRLGKPQINFSAEQAILMDVARRFVADKSPLSNVRKLLETPTGYSESVWTEMVELGWSGVALPEKNWWSRLRFFGGDSNN